VVRIYKPVFPARISNLQCFGYGKGFAGNIGYIKCMN